jgi:hypothetical protein
VRLGNPIPPEPLWPDTLLSWRKDTVRINGVFDGFNKLSICMVIEIEQRSDTIWIKVSDSVQAVVTEKTQDVPMVFT